MGYCVDCGRHGAGGKVIMLTVSQLPERDRAGDNCLPIVIHCPECGDTSSATRGDYFTLPPDHVFVCQCGCQDLRLARKIVSFESYPAPTIGDRAREARSYLYIHGFLSDSENDRVQKRIARKS